MSNLTKDQLKDALTDQGIRSPSNAKKDELVELYHEHVQPNSSALFSSDDEDRQDKIISKKKKLSRSSASTGSPKKSPKKLVRKVRHFISCSILSLNVSWSLVSFFP